MRYHSFGVLQAKRSDEAIRVWFEWFPMLARYWRGGIAYAVDEVVRPLSPTGFAYKRVGGGASAATEPAWPRTLGGSVIDGSGSWEAIAAGGSGMTSASAPVVAVTPSGLTIGSPTLVDGEATNSRVQVLVSGGTNGARYAVTCQVTAGTETYKGTLVIPVDDAV